MGHWDVIPSPTLIPARPLCGADERLHEEDRLLKPVEFHLGGEILEGPYRFA
jgi:hypothetical protein